jgi:hypothetical protein
LHDEGSFEFVTFFGEKFVASGVDDRILLSMQVKVGDVVIDGGPLGGRQAMEVAQGVWIAALVNGFYQGEDKSGLGREERISSAQNSLLVIRVIREAFAGNIQAWGDFLRLSGAEAEAPDNNYRY